jgi:hypothetical protein
MRLLPLVILALTACVPRPADVDPDDVGTDAGSNVDPDPDVDTDPDPDVDTDPDPDVDTDPDSDVDTDPDSDGDTDPDSDVDTSPDSDVDSDTTLVDPTYTAMITASGDPPRWSGTWTEAWTHVDGGALACRWAYTITATPWSAAAPVPRCEGCAFAFEIRATAGRAVTNPTGCARLGYAAGDGWTGWWGHFDEVEVEGEWFADLPATWDAGWVAPYDGTSTPTLPTGASLPTAWTWVHTSGWYYAY